VRINVAINNKIARSAKRKMERASSVNQDIGGTIVHINVVLGARHVEDTMGFAQDAKMVTGVNSVIVHASQLTNVNMLMLTVLKQLVYAKSVKRISGVHFVTKSALMAV